MTKQPLDQPQNNKKTISKIQKYLLKQMYNFLILRQYCNFIVQKIKNTKKTPSLMVIFSKIYKCSFIMQIIIKRQSNLTVQKIKCTNQFISN